MIPILTPNRDAPFADRDAHALQLAGYETQIHEVAGLRDFLDLMAQHVRSSFPVIAWGANFGTLAWWIRLPPVIRNPLILIVAGGEVSDRPRTPAWEARLHRAFRWCDGVVFMSPHLYTAAASRGLPMPQRWAISPLCADPEEFRPLPKVPKTAIMVAHAREPHRLHYKGVDRLLRVARDNPDWTIHLVGSDAELGDTPPNLRDHGFLPWPDLIRLFGHSEIILCLSRWEATPVALIEGMMTGCIPVVTRDVPSLPWAAGDTGEVVDGRVRLDEVHGDGEAARERAIRLFAPQIRAAMWRRFIPEIMHRAGRTG